MPQISIIVPVYQVKEYLCQSVDSILNQICPDMEVILVDDGSTDGSGAICDAYAQKDSRVRVIHQENAGVSAARNAGVAAAAGDYIGFVDSDDIVEKDMFAVLLSWAERENADVVQCHHDRQQSLNEAARAERCEKLDGETFVRRMFTKKGGDYTNQVALWSKIYRRELFEGIVFPAGRTYEDEQETYKLCLKAKKIVEIPDVLYHYVKRENSIITGISAQKMLHKQAALLDRLEYLPKRLPDVEKQCAESFLRFSENILCAMYAQGDKHEMEQAISILLGQKKRLRPYLNKYDKLYLPALRWKCTRKVILRNAFEPVQKGIRKLRGIKE